VTVAPKNVAYGEGRQALIAAAVRLVAREGLAKLTYRSLATEANVTHGTIQHHFASLDDVLEEALYYAMEVTLPTITSAQTPGDFYRQLVDVVHENPDLQAFQMEMILEARRRPRLAAYVRHIYRIYTQNTALSLAALGCADDDELTQVVMGMGDGIIFQMIALGDDQNANAEAQVRGLSRLISTYVDTTRDS
jgi:TetR/AcrR family transcriptional regulator, regulator of biofilm formation and stress response